VNVPLVSIESPPRADFEDVFHAEYDRIAKLLAGLLRDPARAEELAVDVFLKWRKAQPTDDNVAGWLHRTAVRAGLDELRRRSRRERLERAFHSLRRPSTPEDLLLAADRHARASLVLGTLRARDAELLVLRGSGLSYEQLGASLSLNPNSIGTLLSRAQKAFFKEYTKRYGTPE
jgi:RNA polymerase sigma-70 factor (ECF subfamily)